MSDTNLIPVVAVTPVEHRGNSFLFEVPLCATAKAGDYVIFDDAAKQQRVGMCVSDAYYMETGALEMISIVTGSKLPLPKLKYKLVKEDIVYDNREEADI